MIATRTNTHPYLIYFLLPSEFVAANQTPKTKEGRRTIPNVK